MKAKLAVVLCVLSLALLGLSGCKENKERAEARARTFDDAGELRVYDEDRLEIASRPESPAPTRSPILNESVPVPAPMPPPQIAERPPVQAPARVKTRKPRVSATPDAAPLIAASPEPARQIPPSIFARPVRRHDMMGEFSIED